MYKNFKFLIVSILTLYLPPNINSMSYNTDTEFFNICCEYNPYSINSLIPPQEYMLEFMAVKELNFKNDNVKKCFSYLQKYDPQNYLLLNKLLKNVIYSIAEEMSTTSFDIDRPLDKSVERAWYGYLCEDYCYARTHYRKHNRNRYNYVDLVLTNEKISVYNIDCFYIIKFFNTLGCKLNPEKYKKKYIVEESITNINLMEFCYYISNTLVCISHDIVYAINKEINKLSNYDDKIEKSKISKNIENIIKQSFYYIMEALTSLKSGMFFTELLDIKDVKPRNYNNFQKHFENIKTSICRCEIDFNTLLNKIESDKKNKCINNK